MKSTIFIPNKCKVGFNKRSDTYTGKLGYVIYHDGKKWRKEDSWNNWIEKYVSPEEYETLKLQAYGRDVKKLLEEGKRNGGKVRYWKASETGASKWVDAVVHNLEDAYTVIGPTSEYYFYMHKQSTDPAIAPIEFDNTPIEGFVLNRKAGGTKYGWNARQTYCRIYDPRGFEFEVNIQNLLYILENANSIKGKGLEGKFVYGWDGKDLVLVPEDSPEFQEMKEFSIMQNQNVKKSELVPGRIYIDSYTRRCTYLGDGFKKEYQKFSAQKMPWFYVESNKSKLAAFETKDIKSIKKYTGETNPDFANLIDQLEANENYFKSKPEFELIPDAVGVLTAAFAGSNYFLCYAKNHEGKMVGIEINRSSYGYRNNVTYTIYGNITCDTRWSQYPNFESLEKLTNKYELWQLKTTK